MTDDPKPLFDREQVMRVLTQMMHAIFKNARSLTGNDADADDLRQATFLKAMESLDQLRHAKGLYTWLIRIQQNLHIDLQRKKKVEARHVAELKEQATSAKESHTMRRFLLPSEMERLMDLLREEELPAKLWKFVEAGNDAGWDYEKIAEATGWKLGYVRRTMQRLKQWVLAKQPAGMGRCALAGILVVMAWCALQPEYAQTDPQP